jgi:hypothetical protein
MFGRGPVGKCEIENELIICIYLLISSVSGCVYKSLRWISGINPFQKFTFCHVFKTHENRTEALIEIERHRSIQDTGKFYKRLNDVKRPFKAQVAMFQNLNEREEREQSPDQIDLRDDGDYCKLD